MSILKVRLKIAHYFWLDSSTILVLISLFIFVATSFEFHNRRLSVAKELCWNIAIRIYQEKVHFHHVNPDVNQLLTLPLVSDILLSVRWVASYCSNSFPSISKVVWRYESPGIFIDMSLRFFLQTVSLKCSQMV